MAASAPPTIATSTRPARIMCMPSATAWPELAQALTTENAGPRTPYPIEIALTGALSICRGTLCGWMAKVRLLKRR